MLRLLVFLVIASVCNLHAQSPLAPSGNPKNQEEGYESLVTRRSPDKSLLASCQEIPYPARAWDRDLDMTRLTVSDRSQSHSCLIGRLVNEIEWSPDSKFLVLTTSSAGGHSPWHYQSFVYCVSDNSCRRIENSTFCVVAPTIHFSGPHSVDLMASVKLHWDIDHPVSITIDLAMQSVIMEKIIGPVDSGKF